MNPVRTRTRMIPALAMLLVLALCARTAPAQPGSIANLNTVTMLSTTVPTNGDLNPYGVALVPVTRGHLMAGNFLISNFNDIGNYQGTGTTIVQISPSGSFSQFAQIDASTISCPGGVGLTTALVALRSGFVIVGSLPTVGGDPSTSKAGCLIVLNSWGNVVETFSGNHINGPWDMTAVDAGSLAVLFVTNVLNGTVAANGNVVNHGTVVRLFLGIPPDGIPYLLDSTVIGRGFPERTDPVALVIGPTGVAFDDCNGVLYVADTLNNRIAAIPNALFRFGASDGGITLTSDGTLNGPLGLAISPERQLIAANGGNGNLVEINPSNGEQVATKLVDNSGSPSGAGALFWLYAASNAVYFVDDNTNTFNVLH
jgi:DNA-binding beta-propeller fold protein YncE